MVHTLEAIKGGGGSIKVGTTGTISSLMSRELESMKYAPRIALSSRNKSSAATIMAPGAKTSPNRLKPRTSDVEASCSSSCINDINHEFVRKAKNYTRKTQNVPMLNAGNVSLDATPIRKKTEKKGPNMVEIVDIRCGHPDRAWANPIANRLKKLSFSKLSESIN